MSHVAERRVSARPDRDAARLRSGRTASGFRPDIEGLRALAILPVVAYHAAQFVGVAGSVPLLAAVTSSLGRVSGGFLGVDVFFVISGYLITGLLVREASERDRIHFGRFYARRARRILPAATVTLIATVVAAMVILPAAATVGVAVDTLWAALFNADVHFAVSGVDYMGVATNPSPVLHFWSLNDEEKFYLVWPALLTAATWASVKLRRVPLRPALFVALLALALPSLWWSQHLVAAGDPSDYFTALSRAFELAAGGLLAIAMPTVALLPRAARVVGAMVGFTVVVVCMFTYTSLTPFPGVSALPVVLGTLLVIGGDQAGIVARALSLRPVRWVGNVSYSLYLWHWPVLVLAAAAASGHLSPAMALACVALSFLLAWGSRRCVELPAQRGSLLSSTRGALTFGLVAIAATVLVSVGIDRAAQAQVTQANRAAAQGIAPITKADHGLLLIGDSITLRGEGPLQAALSAAGWSFRIDALGGRPIVSGKRATWTPLCFATPLCGADLVLKSGPVPGTVVIALGSNAEWPAMYRVAPPTATDSGLREQRDAHGWVMVGQDSPGQVVSEVATVMSLVPATTVVYWVGIYLDDRNWGNVTWRQTNAAIKATAAKYPNARFLDWAGYVATHHVPYEPDGSHPAPAGMIIRARWLVSQIH